MLRYVVPMMMAAFQPGVSVLAGGISEGGGDYHSSWYGSAWYLGSDPIRACIELSPDFGVGLEQARHDIQSAFQIWDRYMTVKSVNRGPSSDPLYRIVSELQLLASCDGTQELTFYLGGNPPKVEAAKKQFENPMAFVHRENYNLETGRSTGFLWIIRSGGLFPGPGRGGSPDWTMPYNLHGIFLHEVGHLMGVPHLSGTIMDEEWLLSRFQSEDQAFRKNSFTKIDYLREIKMLPTEEAQFEGFFGPWPCNGNVKNCEPKYKEAFQTLTGRPAVGDVVEASFFGNRKGGMQLELRDSAGPVVFGIELSNVDERTQFDLAPNVFKTYRNVHKGNTTAEGYSSSQSGSVEYGNLITPRGERVTMMLIRNSSVPTPLEIQVLMPQGVFTRIFTADTRQLRY